MTIFEKINILEQDIKTLIEEGAEQEAYIASIKLSKVSDAIKKRNSRKDSGILAK